MGRSLAIVAIAIAVLVVVLVTTAGGRLWLEQRIDDVRWFINEVRTLAPP